MGYIFSPVLVTIILVVLIRILHIRIIMGVNLIITTIKIRNPIGIRFTIKFPVVMRGIPLATRIIRDSISIRYIHRDIVRGIGRMGQSRSSSKSKQPGESNIRTIFV